MQRSYLVRLNNLYSLSLSPEVVNDRDHASEVKYMLNLFASSSPITISLSVVISSVSFLKERLQISLFISHISPRAHALLRRLSEYTS